MQVYIAIFTLKNLSDLLHPASGLIIGINLARKQTMKNNFLLIAFVSFGLLISLAAFSPFHPAGLTEDVLKYTNEFRRSKKLAALTMRADLNAIAREHSEDMAKGRVGFGHSGFDQRFNKARKLIKGFRSFAENVAYGVTSGKEVVALWKNSSGHRRNMLGNYRYIGIGTAKDRQGNIYYTQVFTN
jgi:uncharacterized protein YkwD